jgi:hypothetical protein
VPKTFPVGGIFLNECEIFVLKRVGGQCILISCGGCYCTDWIIGFDIVVRHGLKATRGDRFGARTNLMIHWVECQATIKMLNPYFL